MMWPHFVFIWINQLRKKQTSSTNQQIASAGEVVEKREPQCTVGGMQTGEATVENSMEFPQKTKDGTAF